ncbi:MAG: iron-sulfur cluster assembly scaffold protein [Eggerthellaceae bacterium]|nr:iron-sulfur cluster assembly scaffold protein [Eggerthellaceae bacterium]
MEDAVRNVYVEPDDRVLLRTADVYQTRVDTGVEGYSDTLLSVVANFKNAGVPEGANAQSMVGKSKRGEVALRLFAVVGEPEEAKASGAAATTEATTDVLAEPRFLKAGFKARGCLAMTACASVMCEMIEGKTFAEALAITPEDIRAAVDGVPYDKAHTLTFAVEGVRALVGDYLIKRGATLAELNENLPCDNFSVACLLCEHCSLRDARVDLLVAEA